jgi:Zn-dependent protease
MVETKAYEPRDGERIAGHLLGAPVIVKGLTWLPMNQLILWGVMSWATGREHKQWSWKKRLGAGGVTMTIILGSEWLHNLAHTVTARRIGKPVDAVRIFMGMPLLVYQRENDSSVNPDQHILRALGGPIFNACLLALALLVKRTTQPDTIVRSAVDAAVGMNTFLSTASFAPIPGIDGGSILKWSLVKRGKNEQEADTVVIQVNRAAAAGLGLAAACALKKQYWLVGAVTALLAAVSLAVGLGILKEDSANNQRKDGG